MYSNLIHRTITLASYARTAIISNILVLFVLCALTPPPPHSLHSALQLTLN